MMRIFKEPTRSKWIGYAMFMVLLTGVGLILKGTKKLSDNQAAILAYAQVNNEMWATFRKANPEIPIPQVVDAPELPKPKGFEQPEIVIPEKPEPTPTPSVTPAPTPTPKIITQTKWRTRRAPTPKPFKWPWSQ